MILQPSVALLTAILGQLQPPQDEQPAPATLSVVPTSNPAATQGASGYSVAIVKTETAPVIDGRLDDDCWANAAIISNFTQVEPVEFGVPSQRTEVRLLYDKDNLYLGIRCFDTDPKLIVAKQMQRDGDQDSDDRITFSIDPFHDRRNGYFFAMTAAGGKLDGLVDNNTRLRKDWDGIWYGKSSIDEHGWVAEIALPFKTISFAAKSSIWGFNIERVIRRNNETDRWSSPRINDTVYAPAQAGEIENITGIEQGIGLTVRPFVSTNVDMKDGSVRFKPGFDLFYQITPSITASLTVNTDFAEAEVDERRVNLTRFPLFFPEKRAFFLQDADIFSFGGIQQDPLPFFSRRIGLNAEGEPLPILVGAKLTGRQGDLNFGLMDVQMQQNNELGYKNLSVGRVSFNVLEESSAGLIFTNGDPTVPDSNNTLGGADFNFRNSHVDGDNILETHAWIMGSETSDVSNDDPVAFGGRINWPNQPFSFNLFLAQIGSDFNPALGFVDRTGVRNYDNNLTWQWRPTGYIRTIDLNADTNIFTLLNNDIQTVEVTVPELVINTNDDDTFTIGHELNGDFLQEAFEIVPGVFIPKNDYLWNRFTTSIETSTARVFSANLGFSIGGFYDGTSTDYTASITWRPSAYFLGTVAYEQNDIRLPVPNGDFTVRIVSIRADVIFSPSLSWDNIVQYDNISENAGINSRIRWEVQPGNDIFIVLNQGFDTSQHFFQTTTSDLTVKIGWTFRF